MGRISFRLDPVTESALRRKAARSGQTMSDLVRAAIRSGLDRDSEPSTLNRLGDVVGKYDHARTPPPEKTDELGDILLTEHERQAAHSRALRGRR